MIGTKRVQEYVDLVRKRRALEGDVDELKEQIARLEPIILQQMSDSGLLSIRTDDATVSIRRDLRAGKSAEVEWPVATAAMQNAGLGELIEERFNASTLSAYVRELERDGQRLPPALDGIITVTEKFSLSVTKRYRGRDNGKTS